MVAFDLDAIVVVIHLISHFSNMTTLFRITTRGNLRCTLMLGKNYKKLEKLL